MKPTADKCRKKPEQHIQEALQLLQTASLNNCYLHLSHRYTYSPAETGVVVCYVTCPNAIATEIREAVDEAVQGVFAQHRLVIDKQSFTSVHKHS